MLTSQKRPNSPVGCCKHMHPMRSPKQVQSAAGALQAAGSEPHAPMACCMKWVVTSQTWAPRMHVVCLHGKVGLG